MITVGLPPSDNQENITPYIENSRAVFVMACGLPLVIWGLVMMIVSLGIFILWHLTNDPVWNLGWLAVPLLGSGATILSAKHRPPMPENVIRSFVASLWGIFGTIAVILSTTIFGISFILPDWANAHPDIIPMAILLILGVCEAMTGILIGKLGLVHMGIILALVLGIGTTILPIEYSPLMMFAAGFISLFLPGLAIHKKNK